MMNKALIKKLEPIEEEFDCELFTFDEAIYFYKSDLNNFKILINQFIKIAQEGSTNPEFLKGMIAGLNQSVYAADLVFGGRAEEGF